MKKLLSIVLTIAMLASMMSVPMVAGAKTHPTINLNSGFMADNLLKVSNGTKSVEYGIAGKDAADESLLLTETNNTWVSMLSYDHGEEIYFENGAPMSGYLVWEANFMPLSTSKFNSFFVALSNNQARLSQDMTTKNGLVLDKWNHVRVVYWADSTNCDFIDYANNKPTAISEKLGASQTYINGVLVGGTKQLTGARSGQTLYDQPITNLMFEVYSADKNAQHSSRLDDIKIYKSATNPGAQSTAAIAATSEYTVSGTVISLASGANLTPAEIAAANSGYTITAFENNSLTSQLADTAVLAVDNVVVAKSPEGMYTEYTVQDGTTRIIYSESDGNFAWMNKANQTAVKGYAGKSADDESVLLTTNSTYDGNIMIAGTYTKSKKYLVLEANINPVAGEAEKAYMSSVSIHTTKHGTVSTAAGVPLGQWSRYLVYVDFEANKAYTYINGSKVNERAPHANLLTADASLRFCFNGAGGKEVPFSVYVDDMKWYETDTLPDAAARTALPAPVSSTYYSVDGGKIKALPTTTVANIKSENPANKVTVYADASMTALANDASLATTGMVVVLENGYKGLKSYPVVVSYGEVEVYLATGDSGHPFPDINNVGTDNKKATATGVAGKAADDVSMKIIQNGGDTWFGKNWGTTKAGTDANGTGATWDKMDYKGYLVVEFSMFNVDCTTADVVTDESSAVVANFANSIPKNEWSRVKIVVDATNGVKGGTATTYINGKSAGNATKHNLGTIHSTAFYHKAGLRIRLKGGNTPSYVDDIRIYEVPALRPEQTIEFNAPGVCTVTDTAFGIVAGDTVTIADVKAANPGLDIKFFDSASAYTALTGDSTVLTAGNVIFVNEQSQSAKDAGINIKDMFKVLVVEKKASTKDVATAAPASFVRGALNAVSGGVYGNTSSTIKELVNNGAENNCYSSHGHRGVAEGMKYLVWEMDFAPTSDVTAVYFGANQNAGLSDRVYVGDDKTIKANQWNKIVAVYEMATDLSDLYVNGKLVSKDYKGNYKVKSEANNGSVDLRVLVEGTGKIQFKSYIDNYRIYESVFYPEIGAPATFPAGYNAAVSGFVDNTSMIAAVKGGTSADIDVAGYDISVLDSDYAPVSGDISKGDIIFAKKNGNFAYYTADILANNDIVVLGDTYNANTGIMNPGTINAYGITSNGGALIAAQYDDANNLIKVLASENAVNGIINIEFTPDDIDDTKVRVYLFNNFDQIAPLCANKEIKHTRNYNLLMIGNSFSMDVTCYMEEIAAAQGKAFNIHVLNKGGQAVNYHYEQREGDHAAEKINHFKNDVHIGTSNLKTLFETYDYDYVVIQNWGSAVSFYDNTDANYNANWANVVNLAKYINEKEPGAEIMLHETWAFETGYNGWTQAAANSIRAVYDRCARESAAAIGQATPLRKISSLDAFNAAKAYEDGALFETTYYKDGHLFSGYDNRATAPVGDGSMLLSPEDAAAGKVSLHRDGFHASQVGRYLIALNAVQFLTGKSVYGNTYRPGAIALDSSAYYGGDEVTDLDNASSGVIMQKYDPIAENVVDALQTIVESIR